ncbi:hypothetical protein ElyMa_003827800 [Elysia marginata]|uniref:MAM domain-containing protein n=1 Tax=Elysia marginata TaxID=1093978 RepID=A0AAV4FGE6_9GAST|nr:hypothetical protein ElyMa_003827800 [Elysia marginata]
MGLRRVRGVRLWQNYLKGYHYEYDEEVIADVRRWCRGESSEFFSDGERQLVKRWRLCVDRDSDYVKNRVLKAHESECTNDYKGAESNHLDDSIGNWKSPSGQGSTWTYSHPDDTFPLKTDYRPKGKEKRKGGYIYLTNSEKQTTASINTVVSKGIGKLCTIFRYATTSPKDIDIDLHIGDTRQVLYTLKTNNTFGHWKRFGVSCCLTQPKADERMIGFTSTVSPGEVVAIDYIEMKTSKRICDENNRDQCFIVPPPPATKTQASTTERGTASNLKNALTGGADMSQCTNEHKGVSSCHFDAEEDNTCSWKSSKEINSMWTFTGAKGKGPIENDYRPPGKEGEKGGYAYLKSDKPTTASIITAVSPEIGKLCIEFRYATTSPTDIDIDLHIGDTRQVLYTLKTNNTFGYWKRFGVSCCLTQPNLLLERKIGFTSTVAPGKVVAIDYIEMRLSKRTCHETNKDQCFIVPPPPPPPTPPQASTKARVTTYKPRNTPAETESSEVTTVMPTMIMAETESTNVTTSMPTSTPINNSTETLGGNKETSTKERKETTDQKSKNGQSNNDHLFFSFVVPGGLVLGIILIVIVVGLVGLCSQRRESKSTNKTPDYQRATHASVLEDRSRTSSSESSWSEFDNTLTFPTAVTDDYLNEPSANKESGSAQGDEKHWQFYNGDMHVTCTDAGMKSLDHGYSQNRYSHPLDRTLSTFSTASSFDHHNESVMAPALDFEDSLDSVDENIVTLRPKVHAYRHRMYRHLSESSDTSSVYSIPRPSLRDSREKKRRPSVAFVNPLYAA